MKSKQLVLEGVIVPMVTPVTGGGEVDYDGLLELAKWLVDSGVQGLFLAGTTGRFSYFSPEQNMRICAAVAKAVGNQVTIYGGACDSGLKRTVENAKRMKEAGADVAVVLPPYYLTYSVEEVEDTLRRVADLSPLPVVYYSIPQFVGYGIRAEFIAEMADHPNVFGYKDSTNEIAHHLDVLEKTKGKAFDLLIGKERRLAEALKAGSKGIVVAFANAYPKLFVELMQAAKQGDWNKAEELQMTITQILEEYQKSASSRPVFSTLLLYLQELLREQKLSVRLW